MTPKEKLIRSITKLLANLDTTKLKQVYQFILHFGK